LAASVAGVPRARMTVDVEASQLGSQFRISAIAALPPTEYSISKFCPRRSHELAQPLFELIDIRGVGRKGNRIKHADAVNPPTFFS